MSLTPYFSAASLVMSRHRLSELGKAERLCAWVACLIISWASGFGMMVGWAIRLLLAICGMFSKAYLSLVVISHLSNVSFDMAAMRCPECACIDIKS